MRKIIYENDYVLLDDGIFFAKGVFETIPCIEKPILLDKHLNRLQKGIVELELEDLERDELVEFFRKLDIRNKAVKITVTPLNIIITKRNIPYTNEDYIKGASLTFSKVRRNSTSRLCYIKSTSYIENIIEKNEANKKGFLDSLFLNEKGFVTETSCANIFIVKNNRIITPRIEDGLLSGIIREWIIENFKVEVKSITLEELENAEEVFITNSLMGIMPVKKIDSFIYTGNSIINTIKESMKKLGYN